MRWPRSITYSHDVKTVAVHACYITHSLYWHTYMNWCFNLSCTFIVNNHVRTACGDSLQWQDLISEAKDHISVLELSVSLSYVIFVYSNDAAYTYTCVVRIVCVCTHHTSFDFSCDRWGRSICLHVPLCLHKTNCHED